MGKAIALLALVTVVALILSHLRTSSLRASFKRRIEEVLCPTLWRLNSKLSGGDVTVVEVKIAFGDEVLRLSKKIAGGHVVYRAWDTHSSVSSAFWSYSGHETGMKGLAQLVEDAINKRGG